MSYGTVKDENRLAAKLADGKVVVTDTTYVLHDKGTWNIELFHLETKERSTVTIKATPKVRQLVEDHTIH